MPFEIVRNDIVNMKVDAIVNTANPRPIIGAGTDKGVHDKAGAKLLLARKEIGNIATGEAVATSAFNLDAKYVIHTVGPIWKDGKSSEEKLLASCFRNSLEIAKRNSCESIAFPLISTGSYGFPKPLALQIAVREINAFLMKNEMQIYLVVFEKQSFELSEKLFKSVSSYIDANYVSDKINFEYKTSMMRCLDYGEMLLNEPSQEFIAQMPNLDGLLNNLDKGFSETLLDLIDRTGKKDSEIYKKANVDRKLFSKIRNNVDYKPSKATAIAFAIALELNMDETNDLIARAGFTLSQSSKFDVIVKYFIENEKYDIFELNSTLFKFDQPLICM
ncbi:O-acetyl-ADP-ribose deacetylase [[Eubacterium] infirmum]|nr:O-acetyl-ADP-ribose deacetylase [[Eubacterium] infirmum]